MLAHSAHSDHFVEKLLDAFRKMEMSIQSFWILTPDFWILYQ